MNCIGLVINPIAGMGGRVGLKGTDGVLKEALKRGAVKTAGERARQALEVLVPLKEELLILCASGEMGQDMAEELGFRTKLIYDSPSETGAADTVEAVRRMREACLILFAGGDGTARDVYTAVAGMENMSDANTGRKEGVANTQAAHIPVIGIPAGVKIHSPVYAIHPKAAGRLARKFLEGGRRRLREAEVVDLDEKEYQAGRVCTGLFGYLQIPDDRDLFQHGKASSPESEHAVQLGMADDMIERMKPDVYYLIGAGSTTAALMEVLELQNTLIGVDLIQNKQLIQSDLSEEEILQKTKDRETHLVITPTGGQGYLLGRGNQQISGRVIRQIGRERIHILATKEKLFHLQGRPLLVDTGDDEADRMLSGYMRAICAYHEEQMVKIAGVNEE